MADTVGGEQTFEPVSSPYNLQPVLMTVLYAKWPEFYEWRNVPSGEVSSLRQVTICPDN